VCPRLLEYFRYVRLKLLLFNDCTMLTNTHSLFPHDSTLSMVRDCSMYNPGRLHFKCRLNNFFCGSICRLNEEIKGVRIWLLGCVLNMV
ncbi:unnamed protein product, partial [Brassica oleracea var. botrytis]